MKIRRLLTAGVAAGLLALTGCGSSTSSSTPNADASTTSTSSSSGTIRIDVITHGAAGDSFWDVVKAGALQAGKDDGVDLHYQSDADVGKQATLIDNAVADDTDGLVVSIGNVSGWPPFDFAVDRIDDFAVEALITLALGVVPASLLDLADRASQFVR